MKEGWTNQKIGNICDIYDSIRKPVSKKDRVAGPYPYYGASCVQDYVNKYLFDGRYLLIGEDGAKWGSGDNTAYIAEGKFWVNNHAHVLNAKEGYSNDYLCYYFNHFDLTPIVAGAVIPKLTQEKLVNFEVPIPSYKEQDRIVKKLDEAFAKIDGLKQNAEKGLQAVKDLWQATLTSLYIRKDGWNTASLGTIASFKNGVNFTPSSNGNKYKFLGVGDFQKRIEITTNELDYVMTSQAIEPDYYLKKDDILIVRSNGSKSLVGRSVVVAEDLNEPVIYSGFCIRCRVAESLYAPFLNVLFKTKKVRKQLTYGDNGCNISNINQKKLSSLEISFPSFDEQKKIVEEIERVSALCENLQANYEQELDEYEALKQSILRKAFSGEL